MDKYLNVRDDDKNMIWTQMFSFRVYQNIYINGNSNGKYKINSILCDFFSVIINITIT